MKRLAIALLLLGGCSNDSSPPPPPPPPPPAPAILMMMASSWQFQYSPGMPLSPTNTADGWAFQFPGVDGVHYLTQSVTGYVAGQLTATFRVDTSPGAQLFEVDRSGCAGSNNPLVRLYFQRRGDNLSGQGAYEWYRWWSAPAPLDGSQTSLSAAMSYDQWTAVYGKTDQAGFIAAATDMQFIGVTYGGCFAGHGLYAVGVVTFTMTGFGLN